MKKYALCAFLQVLVLISNGQQALEMINNEPANFVAFKNDVFVSSDVLVNNISDIDANHKNIFDRSLAIPQELEAGYFGIRGGIGTDITGGLAYGIGLNYLVNNTAELGILLFGGEFSESTEEGIHTYDETTKVFLFALMANFLFNYAEADDSFFFIAGLGLASVTIEYEESSATDTSLGPALPNGGSILTEEGSGGGTVFNLGVGKKFSDTFDVRFEIPVIVSFATFESASSVIPTFLLTAGVRF